MFVKLTELGCGHLADIPPMSFAKLGREHAPAIIVEDEQGKVAIFLGGSTGELVGFGCSDNRNWEGPYVTDVALELDFESFENFEANSFGQIKLEGQNVFLIFNELREGHRQSRWIKIAECPHANSIGYFQSWRIVKKIDDEVHVLYSKDLRKDQNLG